MVLRNPAVDVAVLETARGGILREGLAFRHCQIGAVLNVAPDHLGTKGIETLADLAKVKSVVVESVARQGHSVLNFDDPITRGMARHARGRIVRSEEHTSELQSLMRISYAVFCLKKKNTHQLMIDSQHKLQNTHHKYESPNQS